MFNFKYPLFLLLLVVAFLLLAWYIYTEYLRKKQWQNFGNMKTLSALMPTRSLLRQRIKFSFLWISFVALVFVVARIQVAGGVNGKTNTLNAEIVAVVDVSNSMLCTDESPSRLEKAKIVLNTFVEKSDNVKFGLVEFAGTAVTRMPLTADASSAKLFINSLSPDDISSQGTAIGVALRQAQRCFSKDKSVAHCILLLTDAENHEDDAVETAKAVASEGNIIIDVVGIGSRDGGNIMVGDTILYDSEGKAVITKFDEAIGKSIAKEGKGKFWNTSNLSDIANDVMEQFETYKLKSGNLPTSQIEYIDKFELFALIAFVFLLLDLVIMERRNHLMDNIKAFFASLKKKKA